MRAPGCRRCRTDTPALPFCQFALSAQRPPQAGYPVRPSTLGEHIKRRRLDLGLTQKQVADRIGVSASTVLLWEQKCTEPALRFTPAVLDFLGYDPLPTSDCFPEWLRLTRIRLGLSRRRFARLLGIDEGTAGRWELGRTHPGRAHWDRVSRLHKAISVVPPPRPISPHSESRPP
jgi:transcriptional regulator with XRE-family HTH domain